MQRRGFFQLACGAAAAVAAPAAVKFPIIDSHVHLYDPSRPQGVPWPDPKSSIYRTFLPADYRKIAEPFGVRGMIEMECSPWVEDNYWVLELAARDRVIVGTVGNLHPSKPDFREHLERLHKNPLFRGIRFGKSQMDNPDFVANLKLLAQAGLTLDTFVNPELAGQVVQMTDKIPDLRIVIDHLPGVEPPPDPGKRREYEQKLKRIGERPQVYVKVSEVFRRVDENGKRVASGGRIPHDLSFYRPRLDQCWDIFGADRVLFASDWTASEPMSTFGQMLGVVQQYFATKGQDAAERFFWKNSVKAYGWIKRSPGQPNPTGIA